MKKNKLYEASVQSGKNRCEKTTKTIFWQTAAGSIWMTHARTGNDREQKPKTASEFLIRCVKSAFLRPMLKITIKLCFMSIILFTFLQSADPYVTGGSAGSRASVPQTRLQKRG